MEAEQRYLQRLIYLTQDSHTDNSKLRSRNRNPTRIRRRKGNYDQPEHIQRIRRQMNESGPSLEMSLIDKTLEGEKIRKKRQLLRRG